MRYEVRINGVNVCVAGAKFHTVALLLAAFTVASWADDKPTIEKLGTIDCDMVEATPIVFHDRLYRFEYVRENYKPNATGKSYFRFMDVETQKPTTPFASGFHLGCAFVWDSVVYVYGAPNWGASEIHVFWSKDLENWETKPALSRPKWKVFNTSVCRDADGFKMAIELGEPKDEVGAPFTMRFAQSKDLLSWETTPVDRVYSKEKYTACPALRFLDGWYYMVYLEAYPGPEYEPHIVRSRDLRQWDSSPLNPIMKHSDDDRRIANERLSKDERERIAKAVNINNSDVDFCEFKGKTIIAYSWGNQQGVEHLAEAVYKGSEAEFLQGFFPTSSK